MFGYLLERALEERRLFWGYDLYPVQRSAAHILLGIAGHVKPGIIGFHQHFLLPLDRSNPDDVGVDEGANALLTLA
ncbi:hypothetical protein KSC_024090 [Ktedonobacter sp. SOSP1-52]|nr:hypothetical protein KSC_024090 [Ktedonobacter sp. SOSP1-52]